jgi:hypothetical protein
MYSWGERRAGSCAKKYGSTPCTYATHVVFAGVAPKIRTTGSAGAGAGPTADHGGASNV